MQPASVWPPRLAPGNRTWRAYLSTQGQGAVNARDRIGNGPWFNAKGARIAANLADLHGDNERDRNLLQIETALTEKGESSLTRARPQMNEHDILTGSRLRTAKPSRRARTAPAPTGRRTPTPTRR